jgi:transcription initiation factor TFIID subunit 5
MLSNRGWNASAGTDNRLDNEKSDDQLRRSTRSSARLQATTIPKEGVVKQLAPYAPYATTPRSEAANALADQQGTIQALKDIPSVPEKLQTLLASVSATKGAEDILALDPADRLGGYSDLETWVEGSLEMYRVCATCYWAIRIADPPSLARIPATSLPHLLSFLS